VGITRNMDNKKLSKSLDGPPFASSTKCTSTRDRIAAGSDKAYFLFNKKKLLRILVNSSVFMFNTIG
jgi:hypothetical protein